MNLYKGINPQPAGTERQPVVVHVDKVDLGFRTDLMPRQLPPGSTPNMQDIRHERGGFRKDFGERAMGLSAMNPILVIVEHKFIDTVQTSYDYYDELVGGTQQFHRLIRMLRNTAGVARTEIWDSTNQQWLLDGIAEPPFNEITDRYVRAVSMLNHVLFAVGGQPIMYREETPDLSSLSSTGDDFPSSTELDAEDETAVVEFSSSETVYQNQFSVNYEATLELTENGTLTVTLAVEIGGEEVATGTLSITATSGSRLQGFVNQSIVFNALITEGTDVTLRLKEIEAVSEADGFLEFGTKLEGERDFRTEEITTPAPTGQYSIDWTVLYETANTSSTWKIELYDSSEAEYVLLEQFEVFGSPHSVQHRHSFESLAAAAGDRFYFTLVEQSDDFGSPGDDDPDYYLPGVVTWSEGVAGHDVGIFPYNKDTDGDPNHGLTYRTVEGTDVVLKSTDGPEACWIEPFADRIVALCDGPDTQILWWSANGDPLEWDTEVEGVDQIALEDTRNDPIDDLQCAAPLTSNALAIFRSRSIMRAVRTGRIEQAIAVNHWLENIGTESPFSRQVTPAGILFLGFDRMVYLLTEGGPQPVGQHIHQELVEKLTDNLHLVDSVFDPVFRHYYLGIPVDGSDVICETYIFELDKFIDKQELVWRVRSGNIQRFALASEL